MGMGVIIAHFHWAGTTDWRREREEVFKRLRDEGGGKPGVPRRDTVTPHGVCFGAEEKFVDSHGRRPSRRRGDAGGQDRGGCVSGIGGN